MIDAILTGVIKLATSIAEAAARSKEKRQRLDPRLESLESERLMRDMLARARADMEAKKAAKKDKP